MFRGVASTFSAQHEKNLGLRPGSSAMPSVPHSRHAAKPHKGFTLIEMLIVMVIIGVLVAVGYPSYTQHVIKANRSAAQGFLMTVANKQEQYMLDARQYATGSGALTTLGLSTPTEVSKNYSISVVADNSATPPSFTLTATPTGGQLANDTECANLTLDQTGSKGISGTSSATECW